MYAWLKYKVLETNATISLIGFGAFHLSSSDVDKSFRPQEKTPAVPVGLKAARRSPRTYLGSNTTILYSRSVNYELTTQLKDVTSKLLEQSVTQVYLANLDVQSSGWCRIVRGCLSAENNVQFVILFLTMVPTQV